VPHRWPPWFKPTEVRFDRDPWGPFAASIPLTAAGDVRLVPTPGHTPGHVVLFAPAERKVFVGDVLFAGSIGRTDLPGGSTEQLLDSIHNKLMPLGDDVEVYSGHGPVTTIGEERLTNPFLTSDYKLGRGRM